MARVLWLLILSVSFAGSIAASSLQDPAIAAIPNLRIFSDTWWQDQITMSNIVAAAVLIYHFGFLKKQMEYDRQRLDKLEKFNDEVLPETYQRRDLTAAQFEAVGDKLDSILRAVRDAGGRRHKGGTV